MRRFALAASSILFSAGPALAQSPVQRFAQTSPESATSDGPVPGANDPSHPATPNPDGAAAIAKPDQEPQLQIRVAAPDRDQLSSHLRIGAAATYGTFSGRFLTDNPIGERLGGSPLVTIDFGFGVSRQLEVAISGDYSSAASGSNCDYCAASSWAIGPMLRYHLVEGTRFDPWMALGVAFRRNSWDYGATRSVDSIEFVRLNVGGDWYATSNVAVGPVLGLGLDTALSEPAGAHRALFALYYAGLRLTLDLQGK